MTVSGWSAESHQTIQFSSLAWFCDCKIVYSNTAMLRLDCYFVLITIFTYPAQVIYGEKIPSQSLLTVVKNTDVTLICRQPSPKYVEQDVIWFFMSMDEPLFKSISDNSHFKLNEVNKSLLIRNVTIEDAGMFICCFDGPCMDTFLIVIEFENILSFAPDVDNDAAEIIVSSKGDFSITAHHGSAVNVEIVNEPNIPICDCFSGNVVCYKRRWPKSTSYYIKNANIQNSGRFVIQSSFMKLKASYVLSILIHGKPVLNIERVQPEDDINFICRGRAYPPPVFDFRLIPADMGYTHTGSWISLHSLVTSNNSTDFSATVTIKQSISGPGIVECEASNTVGVSHAVATLNFFHHNHFQISTTTSIQQDLLQFYITSPTGIININDTVHLQSKAHSTAISNNVVFQYSGTNFSVHAVPQEDAWVASITIIASREDLVTCYAELKNGSQLSEQIRLPLQFESIDAPENEAAEDKRLSIVSILQYLSYFTNFVSLISMLTILFNRMSSSKLAKPSASEDVMLRYHESEDEENCCRSTIQEPISNYAKNPSMH